MSSGAMIRGARSSSSCYGAVEAAKPFSLQVKLNRDAAHACTAGQAHQEAHRDGVLLPLTGLEPHSQVTLHQLLVRSHQSGIELPGRADARSQIPLPVCRAPGGSLSISGAAPEKPAMG